MIKITNILTEMLNTYQVECVILSDRNFNISDILNQVRGLHKVTIVNNVTPPDYPQKEKTEYTKITLKFITREDPKVDLEQFRKDMLKSDLEINDLRVPGIKTVKFKPETLSRL